MEGGFIHIANEVTQHTGKPCPVRHGIEHKPTGLGSMMALMTKTPTVSQRESPRRRVQLLIGAERDVGQR